MVTSQGLSERVWRAAGAALTRCPVSAGEVRKGFPSVEDFKRAVFRPPPTNASLLALSLSPRQRSAVRSDS